MGRKRGGFLCCFSRSPPPRRPPSPSSPICAAHAATPIERNGSIHHPPNQGSVEALKQQQQMQKEVAQIEQKLDTLKGDLAREMGYPLATRLIHEVSAVFDPNVEKMSLRRHPNPWGWLQRNVDFKRALAEQGDSIPDDMKSVDVISYKAAHIMAHTNSSVSPLLMALHPWLFISSAQHSSYNSVHSSTQGGHNEHGDTLRDRGLGQLCVMDRHAIDEH